MQSLTAKIITKNILNKIICIPNSTVVLSCDVPQANLKQENNFIHKNYKRKPLTNPLEHKPHFERENFTKKLEIEIFFKNV